MSSVSRRSVSSDLGTCVAGGAVLWSGLAAAYGLIEAGMSAAVGLGIPGPILRPVLLVYALFGAAGGLGAGLALLVWRRLATSAPRPAAFLIAVFHAGLLLGYVGLRINDRLLGDMVTLPSMLVNAVLLLLASGLGVAMYRGLRGQRVGGLVLSTLTLVVACGAFVSVGLYLDTFVAPEFLEPRALAIYGGLALACVAAHRALRIATRAVTAGGVGLWLLVSVGGAAALALTTLGRAAPTPPARGDAAGARPPNVVWIVLDTTRADHLGSYGYRLDTTPHVDAIATEGVLFERAIAGSSWTVPSHFQMVTGRFDSGKQTVLLPDFETAAETFRRHGWDTGAVLANLSLGRLSGFEQGFETVVDGPPVLLYLEVLEKLPLTEALLRRRLLPTATVLRYLHRKTFMMTGRVEADAINARVVSWLRERDPATPFFLFVNYLDPHEPYDPPEPFKTRFAPDVDREVGYIRWDRRSGSIISTEVFVRDVLPQLTADDLANLVRLYDGDLAFLDAQVGALVAELERLGQYDRTILVVTSDHGELFGEHGLATHFKALTEEEIRVPLILRYPRALPAGRRVARPVELVDVLPTVYELAGIDTDAAVDGRSLLSLVGSEAADGWSDRDTHSFLLRKPRPAFPHTAPGHLFSVRTEGMKYVWSSTGRNLFYDLKHDPMAEENLYDGRTTPLVSQAEGRLSAWRHRVGLDSIETNRKLDRLTEERLKSLGYIN